MSLQDLKTETDKVVDVRNNFHSLFVEITRLLNSEPLTAEVLVDYGFMFRELENVLDDWRKDCKAAKELVERAIGKASINDDGAGTKIRGEYATGTLDIKMIHKWPDRNTPEFYALMSFLGIPEDAVGRGVVGLNWNRMNEYLSQQLALGNKPPPGVVTRRPQYKVVFRKRK